MGLTSRQREALYKAAQQDRLTSYIIKETERPRRYVTIDEVEAWHREVYTPYDMDEPIIEGYDAIIAEAEMLCPQCNLNMIRAGDKCYRERLSTGPGDVVCIPCAGIEFDWEEVAAQQPQQ